MSEKEQSWGYVKKEKWENGIFLHITASTLKFFNLQAKIPRFDLLTNQIRRMQKEIQDKTLPPLHLFFPPFKTRNVSRIILCILVCFRVTKVLFPPIPRPPPKYKYFLEKSDTFNVSTLWTVNTQDHISHTFSNHKDVCIQSLKALFPVLCCQFFYSTPSAKPEEVITEVEDTGKNPGK